MRGELIEVWDETFREIWTPLLKREGVPDDIYAALYGALFEAIEHPFGNMPFSLQINDTIQRREAFDRALHLSGLAFNREQADASYETYFATDLGGVSVQRSALEKALAALLDVSGDSVRFLDQALYELHLDLKKTAEARERALEVILNNPGEGLQAFEGVRSSQLKGERATVAFLEAAFDVLNEYGGDALSNPYFNALDNFVSKYSLRYDLRRPCTICPTLPGIFASLIQDLHTLAKSDGHLGGLMKDFESAVRDLRTDVTEGRIKTCIQKQVNLIEAIGRRYPGITQSELGGICGQLTTWPHKAIRTALGSVYGFASDYPGIRHGGTPQNAIRNIEMRDMVAISVLLAGFLPYLSDELIPDEIYRRT